MSFSEPVLVVLGGGAAGLAGAVEAARIYPGRVMVLDQAPLISVGTCGLPYLVGGQIARPEALVLNDAAQLEARGLVVRLHSRVQSIDLTARRVTYQDLERGSQGTLPFQNLLLTLGGQCDFPGAHFANVISPRDMVTSLRARAWMGQPECRRVLVVGAGYLGLELAEAARFAGKKVTVVDPTDRLLGLTRSDLVEAELKRQGVDLQRARLVAWEGEGLARQGVLSDGQRLPFDLALVATGVRPTHSALQELSLERGPTGGIRVDRQGRTSRGGVFAAGDGCEIPRRDGPGHVFLPLARPAALLGRVAGAVAVGQPGRFHGCLPCGSVKVFDLEVAWAGTPPEQAEVFAGRSSTRSSYWPDNGWLDLTLFFAGPGGPLRAAQAVGSEGAVARIQTLALAIEQNLAADQLANSDYAYTPPFSGLWDPIVRTVRPSKRWA
ncbi:FAD-dependent oxidoreductase [bacterium]|nr:FAD-dependent oxidoreductase [bacterium]